jgi:hypothetical protein
MNVEALVLNGDGTFSDTVEAMRADGMDAAQIMEWMMTLVDDGFTVESVVRPTKFWGKGSRRRGGGFSRPEWTETVEHRTIRAEFVLEDGTPAFVEVDTDYYEPSRFPRAYVSDVEIDKETIEDQLFNRRNRPSNFWTKSVMPVAKPLVATALEMMKDLVPLTIEDDWKFSWSQNAGCSMCPCSPGYIMRGVNVLNVRPSAKAKTQTYCWTKSPVGVSVSVHVGATYADYAADVAEKRAAYEAKKADEECAKLERQYLNI